MSQDIWTPCGGRRNCRPLSGRPFRVVEAQHVVSTRKLVDSDEEQRLLEELIDTAKPPVPNGCEGLHYLLFTPFRHPPLRHGSRFGRRHEPSLFYASEEEATALAEVAYYRLVFLEGTAAPIQRIFVELSSFQVEIASDLAIDLTEPPFSEYRLALTSPTSYGATQALGSAMRADGIEVIRYASARAPAKGANVALFTPRVFTKPTPGVPRTWLCVTTPAGVEFSRKDYFQRETHTFPRALFEVSGTLPLPST